MAKAKKSKKVTVKLTLTGHEAGALLDVLSAHVGGLATCDEEVLGRIRVALKSTEVERVYLTDKRFTFPTDETIKYTKYPVLEELEPTQIDTGW